MKSSRVSQVRAGAALDLRTLGCKMVQGANLSEATGFHHVEQYFTLYMLPLPMQKLGLLILLITADGGLLGMHSVRGFLVDLPNFLIWIKLS